MQVGDLVRVLPAGAGVYIITEQAYTGLSTGMAYWHLSPVYGCDDGGCGPMSEEYIEVISESR
jgi:hypothetical protein